MFAAIVEGRGFACWHPNVTGCHGVVIAWKKKKDAAFYLTTNNLQGDVVDIRNVDVRFKLA